MNVFRKLESRLVAFNFVFVPKKYLGLKRNTFCGFLGNQKMAASVDQDFVPLNLFTPSEQINILCNASICFECNRKELIYICVSTIILAQRSKRANPFQTDLSI